MSEVSVVIPAYNPGSYLQSTLDSLAAQTFTAWEAVIVDDGSTEDLSWVDDYDARVRRQRQENAGLSAARNAGISASSAPLVAFLDADDLWMTTKLIGDIEHPLTFWLRPLDEDRHT